MAFIKSDRDQIDLDVTATDIMLITKDDTTILTGATDTEAGLMVGADKDRLDNLELNDLADVTKNIPVGHTDRVAMTSDGSGNIIITEDDHLKFISDNKFYNGSGEILTSENWAQTDFNNFTYAQNDSDLAFGHVSYQHVAGRVVVRSEQEIFVNPYAVYRIEASFKHRRTAIVGDDVLTGDPENNAPGSFFGITQYDNVGNEIRPTDKKFTGGSLSTLFSDYTPGDTTMEVDNVDGWDFTDTDPFRRSLIMWDYVSGTGQVFQPHTYARGRYIKNAFDINATPTSITGGFRIPLNGNNDSGSLFSGSTFVPTGTEISQGASGSTYKYIAGANIKIQPNLTEWFRYYGYVGGVDNAGQNHSYNFNPGTAFIRILTLPLWTDSYKSDRLHLSTAFMHVDAGATLEEVTIVNAASGNDGKRYDIYRPVASSTGVVSQLMTKGVV